MPPDNPDPIAPGALVPFPANILSNGGIVRLNITTFVLPLRGFYEVLFQVPVNEAAQLVISLDSGGGFFDVPNTVVGRPTGGTQIVGIATVEATIPGTLLGIRNPAANFLPITLTPNAGGQIPVSASLVIKLLMSF
jgi:hypothetical protein